MGMEINGQPIPQTLSELENLVVDQHEKIERIEKEKAQYETEKNRYEIENKILREQIKFLTQKLFGQKSEKYSVEEQVEQLQLFKELDLLIRQVSARGPSPVVVIKEHTRKGSGRQALPASLPREIVIIDVLEAEKMCGCGCEKDIIGEEVSEKLVIIRKRLVNRMVRAGGLGGCWAIFRG